MFFLGFSLERAAREAPLQLQSQPCARRHSAARRFHRWTRAPLVCLKHRWIGPCPCQADTAQGAQQPQQDGGTGSHIPPCCLCLWCISSLSGLVLRNETGKCISSKYEKLHVLIPLSISLSLPCPSRPLRGLVPLPSPDVAGVCSRGGIWGARGRGALSSLLTGLALFRQIPCPGSL